MNFECSINCNIAYAHFSFSLRILSSHGTGSPPIFQAKQLALSNTYAKAPQNYVSLLSICVFPKSERYCVYTVTEGRSQQTQGLRFCPAGQYFAIKQIPFSTGVKANSVTLYVPGHLGPFTSSHSEPTDLREETKPEPSRGCLPGRRLAGGSGSPFRLQNPAQRGGERARLQAGTGILTCHAEPGLVSDGFQGPGGEENGGNCLGVSFKGDEHILKLNQGGSCATQ